MAYHRTHDVDARIVRIFNTDEPRMRPQDGRGRVGRHLSAASNRGSQGAPPDIPRARAMIGWEPRVPVRERIARTAVYFRRLLRA